MIETIFGMFSLGLLFLAMTFMAQVYQGAFQRVKTTKTISWDAFPKDTSQVFSKVSEIEIETSRKRVKRLRHLVKGNHLDQNLFVS